MKKLFVALARASGEVRWQYLLRRVVGIGCISVAALTVSGCAGLLVNAPQECESETPYPGVHDRNLFKVDRRKFSETASEVFDTFGLLAPEPRCATKDEFLKEWGKPDKIITTSGTEETWIYEKHLWCGVCPVFLLPLPLVLPVCDGFDKIEFKDGAATRLHTRRNSITGLLIFFYPFAGAAAVPVKEDACRNTTKARPVAVTARQQGD